MTTNREPQPTERPTRAEIERIANDPDGAEWDIEVRLATYCLKLMDALEQIRDESQLDWRDLKEKYGEDEAYQWPYNIARAVLPASEEVKDAK